MSKELVLKLSKIQNHNSVLDKSTKTIKKYHLRVPSNKRTSTYDQIIKSLKSQSISFEEKMIQSESSSIPVIEFSYFDELYRVVVKPLGGGSGAGARATAIGESAQCLYLAAHRDYKSTDFTAQDLSDGFSNCACDVKLEEIRKELSEDWVKSSITGAKLLKGKINPTKNYTYHRGSSWVTALETQWKVINKKENVFSNINKWSPADIWIVENGLSPDWTQFKNYVQLNDYIEKMFNEKRIMGVSLKKVVGATGRYSVKNLTGAVKKTYAYKGYTFGKTFFSSKDWYIEYEGGKIQMRTFGPVPSSWQGEIKGQFANQGKVGGGVLQNILKRVTGETCTTPNTVKVDKKHLEKLYKYFNELTNERMDYEKFVSEVSKKTVDSGVQWFYSKYLGAEICSVINSYKNPNDVTTEIISYASSQSSLSGVYAKVE